MLSHLVRHSSRTLRRKFVASRPRQHISCIHQSRIALLPYLRSFSTNSRKSSPSIDSSLLRAPQEQLGNVLDKIEAKINELRQFQPSPDQKHEYHRKWVQFLSVKYTTLMRLDRFNDGLATAREVLIWSDKIEDEYEHDQLVAEAHGFILTSLAACLEEKYDATLAAEAQETFFRCMNTRSFDMLSDTIFRDYVSWLLMDLSAERFTRALQSSLAFLESKSCKQQELILTVEIIKIVSYLSLGNVTDAVSELEKSEFISSDIRDRFNSFIKALSTYVSSKTEDNISQTVSAGQKLVSALIHEVQPPIVAAQILRIILSTTDLSVPMQKKLTTQTVGLFIDNGDLERAEKVLYATRRKKLFHGDYTVEDADELMMLGRLLKSKASALGGHLVAPSLSNSIFYVIITLIALLIFYAQYLLSKKEEELQAMHQRLEARQERLLNVVSDGYDQLIADVQTMQQLLREEKEEQQLDDLFASRNLKD